MKRLFDFFTIISFSGIVVFVYNIVLAYYKYFDPKFTFPDTEVLGKTYEFSFHFVLICLLYIFVSFTVDIIKSILRKQKNNTFMIFRLVFVLIWLFVITVNPGSFWQWFID
jgi:hypothetical protein